MRKALVEAVGTFFLVLVIGLTVVEPGAGAMAPLAIGAILMAMVYAGGPISGAHYNPAVTLAVWLRGQFAAKDAAMYVVAQAVGASLAAGLVDFLKGGSVAVAMQPQALPAFLVELLFTFALAYVVLNVATTKTAAGNSYFGLAIGITVTAAAYAGGGISGGAFNPAVAASLALLGVVAPESLWIFFAANLAGGVLAALLFRLTNPDAHRPAPVLPHRDSLTASRAN
jgi:aquaporin Z